MSTNTPSTAELMQLVVKNLERASKGERDPDAMDQALKELDLGREELRKRIGTVNIAVDLIHHARNP